MADISPKKEASLSHQGKQPIIFVANDKIRTFEF